MSKRLSDFKVLTFDCYGTLVDWETGLWQALQPLFQANGRSDVARATALSIFGEAETAEQQRNPRSLYPDILAEAHRAVAQRLGLATSSGIDVAFGASISDWPPFADTPGALRALKRRYKLVIFDVDRRSIAATTRMIGVSFDAIYTAEDIGSYKPARRNFEYMLERLDAELGFAPTDVLHIAQSLYHDHAPAKALGLATAWIDRLGLARGGSWGATAAVKERPVVDFTFSTLGAMADAVTAACA